MTLMNYPYHKSITIGVSDLSTHRIIASLLSNTLKSMGFKVNRIYAPHRDNFDKLQSGEIDILCSAALPGADLELYQEVSMQVPLLELDLNIETQTLWTVPDYIPGDLLNDIRDLRTPKVLRKMRKAIQGVCPGAGITRMSKLVMDGYGLDKSGYRFFTGTEECCTSALLQAYARQEWIVVPIWKPHVIHRELKLRELNDSKSILGRNDRTVLLLRADRKDLFSADQLQILKQIRIGNEMMDELGQGSVEGPKLDEITQNWLLRHHSLFHC